MPELGDTPLEFGEIRLFSTMRTRGESDPRLLATTSRCQLIWLHHPEPGGRYGLPVRADTFALIYREVPGDQLHEFNMPRLTGLQASVGIRHNLSAAGSGSVGRSSEGRFHPSARVNDDSCSTLIQNRARTFRPIQAGSVPCGLSLNKLDNSIAQIHSKFFSA